jgi:2-oxoisovalerate dehydrogenase E1 component
MDYMTTEKTIHIPFRELGLKQSIQVDLYYNMLLSRMIEEKMLLQLRQGKISKWFSGIGQEAIAVGATLAIDKDEFILPMHRNLGVFTSRGIPLEKLFMQWQGKENGFTKGRDRSFHFGTRKYHIHGMISHLGPQLSVADGLALGDLLSKSGKATLVFTGEGGTSEGEFHEALNVAAVWDLPVIFLVENNGYGLSTPSSQQFKCKQIADKGIGYNIESKTIDGNNVMEVYETVQSIAESMRKNPKPFLLECMTFRVRGHEEASGIKYVPKELTNHWIQKDPLVNFERYLLEKGILNDEKIQGFRDEIKARINTALKKAYSEPDVSPDSETEINDIYAPNPARPVLPGNKKTERRFVDAISNGLHQAMEKMDHLILMGQDIADYGGVFKVTKGFLEDFGKDRVRNTPLCESAILGIGLGLSVIGYKSMIEMQFADFVSCGFNQIVNNLAKVHYRWGQNADVVVRMPTGAGVNAGPFHSQSNEAWFFHVPGLKIVYPSNPFDAKGLLIAALEDPNPVLFFEHKYLYRSISGPVPDDYYNLPIGKAKTISPGTDLSIITYGMGVEWAKEAVKTFSDLSIDIVDLRTLLPYDREAIETSVKKTGKVIILHEDTLTGGIGGEIAAFISENLFEYLDGPVMRVGSMDTPVPFIQPLEQQFLPKERLMEKIRKLMDY